MEDLDSIESLDPQAAREYVLAFITTLQQTQTQCSKKQQELELWQRRVALAAEKGESSLKTAAEGRVSELTQAVARLQAEEHELAAKVTVLKSQLRNLQAQPVRTIDVDLLLAQLEVFGDPQKEAADRLSRTLAQEEADAALKDLKKKLKEDQ